MKNELAEAVAQITPDVVRLNGRPRIPSTGMVWSEGTIVTASHTIHHDEEVGIAFADGEEGTAKLVGRDPSTDVAVLKAGTRKPAAPRTDALRVGNIVLAIGRPGRSVRAAFGIVSALGDQWRTRGGGRIDRYIEVDGSLPAGFSGGPLIDADGALIGMNTSRVAHGGTTIPASTLTRIVEQILAHGTITRPFLGIAVYPVKGGMLVLSVKEGSAAANAGVLVGDIVIAESQEALRDIIDRNESTLRITRGGEAKELALKL